MAPGGFPSSSGWGGVDGRDVVDVVDRARPASTRSTTSMSSTPSTARPLGKSLIPGAGEFFPFSISLVDRIAPGG
jgi:hypothetical protein